MQVISRKEALTLGLTRYFTGKPCPHGHISLRMISDYGCIICKAKAHTDWVSQNRDALNAYQHERYVHINKERLAQRTADRALRDAAKRQGRTTYLSILPCKRNHIGPRTVSHGTCIICRRDRDAASRQRNPTAHRTKTQTYRSKHRDKERARQKASKARQYAADPRLILDRNRNWRHQNIIKVLVRNDRRLALELGADGVLTAEEREELLAQAKRCYYCAKPFGRGRPKTLDHIQALTKGGRNDRFNIGDLYT